MYFMNGISCIALKREKYLKCDSYQFPLKIATNGYNDGRNYEKK